MKISSDVYSPGSETWEVRNAIKYREVRGDERLEGERIKRALHVKAHPRELPQRLDLKALGKMAEFVNKAHVHYSGNCALLAAAFYYNATNQRNVISVGNADRPWQGFESDTAHEVILGAQLEKSCSLLSLQEVSTEILRRYEVDRQRFFVVAADEYYVAGFKCGHDFNAVVLLDDSENPYVQFVDAWKTSDTTPAFDKLVARFSANNLFYVYS